MGFLLELASPEEESVVRSRMSRLFEQTEAPQNLHCFCETFHCFHEHPSMTLWNLVKEGGRREVTPQNSPLTS